MCHRMYARASRLSNNLTPGAFFRHKRCHRRSHFSVEQNQDTHAEREGLRCLFLYHPSSLNTHSGLNTNVTQAPRSSSGNGDFHLRNELLLIVLSKSPIVECAVKRLSWQTTTDPGLCVALIWKSTPLVMWLKRNLSRYSDSSCLKPIMRLVKPWLM